jgi:multidrug efflux pump subunit AcrA (membrane-fusion protein)
MLGRLCLLFLFGALFTMTGCSKKSQKKEAAPIPVEVDAVKRQNLRELLQFTGDLQGEAEVQVFSTVPDRIQRLNVDVGDVVKKGQLLAVIEHTRFRQVVAQMQAQLAAAQSQLAAARVSLAGSQVAQFSSSREYNRLKKLLKGGAVGEQQVDMSKTQYDGATTQVQAARAQIRALEAQINALRSSVAQAQTAQQNAIVRAPIDGIVSRRFRQMGDMATPQLPLVILVQMDQVKVNVQMSEEELNKARLGKEAQIQVVTHPGRIFMGRVSKVAPTLDLDTRTAPVEIEIPNIYPMNPERPCRTHGDCADPVYDTCYRVKNRNVCVEKHPLKPGMIAQVNILVKEHPNSVVIPAYALLNDSLSTGGDGEQQKLAVLLLDAKDQPLRRRIEIGIRDRSGMLQVISGLSEGERIIINGQNLFRDGFKIRVVKDLSRKYAPTKLSPPQTTVKANGLE